MKSVISIRIRNLVPVLTALLMTACAVPPISLMDTRPGQTLASGDSATVHFFPCRPSQDTGVVLQAGARYALDIKLLNFWVDGDIEETADGERIDEMGFSNSQMPFEFLGSLRRASES